MANYTNDAARRAYLVFANAVGYDPEREEELARLRHQLEARRARQQEASQVDQSHTIQKQAPSYESARPAQQHTEGKPAPEWQGLPQRIDESNPIQSWQGLPQRVDQSQPVQRHSLKADVLNGAVNVWNGAAQKQKENPLYQLTMIGPDGQEQTRLVDQDGLDRLQAAQEGAQRRYQLLSRSAQKDAESAEKVNRRRDAAYQQYLAEGRDEIAKAADSYWQFMKDKSAQRRAEEQIGADADMRQYAYWNPSTPAPATNTRVQGESDTDMAQRWGIPTGQSAPQTRHYVSGESEADMMQRWGISPRQAAQGETAVEAGKKLDQWKQNKADINSLSKADRRLVDEYLNLQDQIDGHYDITLGNYEDLLPSWQAQQAEIQEQFDANHAEGILSYVGGDAATAGLTLEEESAYARNKVAADSASPEAKAADARYTEAYKSLSWDEGEQRYYSPTEAIWEGPDREMEAAVKDYRAATGASKTEAEEHFRLLERTINEEEMQGFLSERQEKINDSNLYAAGASALSIAEAPFRGVPAMYETLLGDNPEGFGTDINSPNYRMQNDTDVIRGTVTSKIQGDGTDKVRQAAAWAYQIGMSMGDSAVNMAITGVAGGPETFLGSLLENVTLGTMGASAGASAYKEARSRGLTDEQAKRAAVISGAAEYVTEKISIDSFFSLCQNNSAAARKMASVIAQQTAAEGTEEVASDLINYIGAQINEGDQSERNRRIREHEEEFIRNGMDPAEAHDAAVHQENLDFFYDCCKSFAGGAASGFLFGAAAGTYNYVNLSNQASQTYNQDTDFAAIRDSIDTNRDDYANKSAHTSAMETRQIAGELADKQAAGKKISRYDLTRLYRAQQDAIATESAAKHKPAALDLRKLDNFQNMTSDEQQFRINELSIKEHSGIATDQIAGAMYNAQSADQLVAMKQETDASSDDVTRRQGAMIFQSAKDRMIGEGRATREDFQRAEAMPTREELYERALAGEQMDEAELRSLPATLQQAYRIGQENRILSRNMSEIGDKVREALNIKTGEDVNLTGVGIEVDKGKRTTYVTTDTGEHVSLDDLQLSGDQRVLYENAMEQSSQKMADVFLDNAPTGMPVGRYVAAFKYYEMQGASGNEFVDAERQAPAYARTFMTEEQRRAIFDAALEQRNEDVRNENAGLTVARRGEGKVYIPEGVQISDGMKNFLEASARKLGVDIDISDKISEDVNGQLETSMMKATLGLEARTFRGGSAMLNTGFHELFGEYLAAYNQKGHTRVQDALFQYMTEHLDKADLGDLAMHLSQYQKAYNSVEGAKKMFDAMGEMFNDSIAGLFSTPEGIHDLTEWMQKTNGQEQAVGFLQNTANFFKKIGNMLSNALGLGQFSKASERSVRIAKDKAADIRRMILDEMDVAIENVRNAEVVPGTQGRVARSVSSPFGRLYLDDADIGDYLHSGNRRNIKRQERYKNGAQLIIHNETEFNNFVSHAIRTGGKGPVAYGTVGTNLSDQIYEKSGGKIDASGFYLEMIGDELQHGYREHSTGDGITSLDMTPDDMIYALKHINEGTVEIARRYSSGDQRAYISVPRGDGTVMTISTVSNSAGAMRPQTIMKVTNEFLRERYRSVPDSAGGMNPNNSVRSGNASNQNLPQPRNSVNVDSTGRTLSPGQQDYFKDSKVRDENGALKVMYHGTQNDFNIFDFSQGGKNGAAEGFGIYLTDNKEVSDAYGDRVIEGYVNMTRPASSERKTMKRKELASLIRQTVMQEAQRMAEEDYDGDVDAAAKDSWISNYTYTYDKSLGAAINDVADQILGSNDNDMAIIQEVMAGMGIRDYNDAVSFYDTLTDITGFDGFVTSWENKETGLPSQIALAFKSEQIKNVDNESPTSNPDIRYSLQAVDPVEPSFGSWRPGATFAEAKAMYPRLFDTSGETETVRNPTQVANTVKTYRKVYDYLKQTGFAGSILDASSGLGEGTRVGRNEYGYDVDDIEPYPSDEYAKTLRYKDYSTLFKGYDFIINNAVLNVMCQDDRDALVTKMGEMLNPGGTMFINVRGIADVEAANGKQPIDAENHEWYMSNRSYQKGFSFPELTSYLQDALGDDFSIERAMYTENGKRKAFPGVSVFVHKSEDAAVDPRYSGRSFSVNVDTSGRQLTPSQQEYFNGTKAVDKDGKLLTLYHGSHDMAFTEFDTSIGTWLTPDQRYAEVYATDWHNWRDDDPELAYKRSDINGLEKEVYTDPDLRVYEVYANIQNPLDVGEIDGWLSDGKVREIYNAMGVHDSAIYRELKDLAAKHMEERAYFFTRSEEFLDFARRHGFDGLTATENGKQTFCVFDEANQVKLVTNQNPTSNPDIRYAVNVDRALRGNDPVAIGRHIEDLGVTEDLREQTVQAIRDVLGAQSRSAKTGIMEIGRRHRVLKEMLKDGNLSLVGQNVKNADDLAAIAQIYRDPRFETMRYFFTDKDGKIVYESAVTSKIPNAAAVMPSGISIGEYLDTMAAKAQELGATGYYLEHNHPSGNPAPSAADWSVTRFVNGRYAWRGLEEKGHVILDHTQYAVLDSSRVELAPDGNAFMAQHDTRPVPGYAIRDIVAPGEADPSGLIGKVVNSADKVAEFANYLKDDSTVLVFADAKLNAGLIQSVPNKLLNNKKAFRDYVHDVAVSSGMSNVFAVCGDSESFDNAEEYFRGNVLLDAIYAKSGASVRDMGASPSAASDTSFLGIEHGAEELTLRDAGGGVNSLRRSLTGVDDDWWSFGTEAQDRTYTAMSSILEDGLNALAGQPVDEKAIKSIARKLRSQYSSTYDLNTFSDNLAKVFAYAQQNKGVDYQDMMRILEEVARPVLEESNMVVGREEQDAFIEALRPYTIKLTDRMKDEVVSRYGSYQEFRKAMKGIKISNNGTPLDTIWGEMMDRVPGMLDADVPEADMPIMLADVLDSLSPHVQNMYGESMDEAATDLALEIVENYFQEAGMQAGKEAVAAQKAQNAQYRENVRAKAAERLRAAAAKSREANKAYRARVREKYQQNLADTKAEMRERYRAQARELRADRDNRLAELKAANRQRNAEARERRAIAHEKSMINSRAGDLTKWLLDPSDQHHVPKKLENVVSGFLGSIDFVDPHIQKTADGRYRTRIFDGFDEAGNRTYRTTITDTREEALQQYREALEAGKGSQGQRRWFDTMGDLAKLYQDADGEKNFDDAEVGDFIQSLDPALAEELQDMLQRNRGVAAVSLLGSQDLHTISQVLRNITRAVNQENRAYSTNAKISELGDKVIELGSRGYGNRKNHSKGVGNVLDFMQLHNATPVTVFRRMGDAGDQLYKMLRHGQNQKVRDIREAQEYTLGENGILKGVNMKGWSGRSAKTTRYVLQNGQQIELTPAQVMTLYELSKREQAMLHQAGGFSVERQTIKGKEIRQKDLHLTDADIANITGTLTQQQKDIADGLQKFLADNCSRWGNDTSLNMYGYEKFGDPNYFPIRTDKTALNSQNNNQKQSTLNAIKNMGFTKKVVPNAQNPIVISDIFDVFTSHVQDMATYHGYAAPVTDLIRFLNHKNISEQDENGFVQYSTVKGALEEIFGMRGENYIDTLIRSLNEQEQSSYFDGGILSGLTSNAKAAAIAGNIRVVIQQPTAYMRAGAVMGYNYLAKAAAASGDIRQAAREMQDNTSDISWWKSQGFWETSIGPSMKQMLTGDETAVEKATDALMKPAGLADDATWRVIYRAVYMEQLDAFKQAGKDVTGDEFTEAVNDRFDDVIDRTQVVDSTLHRSQMMRAKDPYSKMLTNFMAEPTKSWNMFLQAYNDAVLSAQENGGKIAPKAARAVTRAAGVYTVTNLVLAAAQSLVDAFRKGKDEDEWLERYLAAYRENFLDNMNPLDMLPVVKDLGPIMKAAIEGQTWGSGDNSRMDMTTLNNLAQAFYQTSQTIQGNPKLTGWGLFRKDLQALSQVLGLPAYNVLRDAEAIYNNIPNKPFGLPDTPETSISAEKKAKKTEVFSAIDNGGDAFGAIETAVGKGYTYEGLESGLTTQYKQQYIDLMEAGDPEAKVLENRLAMVYDYLNEKEGQKKADSTKRVQKWYTDWQKVNGEPEEENVVSETTAIGASMLDAVAGPEIEEPAEETPTAERQEWEPYVSDYQGAYDVIDSGDGNVTDTVNELISSGKKASTVKSTLTKTYKPKMQELYATDKDAAIELKQRLIEAYMATGMTRDEANDKINEWVDE